VVAVLKRPQTVSSPIDREAGAVVVLDAIADPGNAGTILRTAAAVGCAAVLAAQGSVDLFAPKVVRAGMGAHFRLHLRQPVLYEDLRSILPGRTIMACDMDGRQSIFDLQFPATFALVVGNEAHGLSHTVRSSVDLTVRIPMAPGVESLNAAVAAAVVLYEALGRSL
jgi:TrmH family RNA methyltransferase